MVRKHDFKHRAIDAYVGQRLKLRRGHMGLTQTQLADMLGLTFQQIQKYEKGQNRIGAGRLYHLARALNMPINYFFDQAPYQNSLDRDLPSQPPASFQEDQSSFVVINDSRGIERQIVDLNRAFRALSHPQLRRQIVDLVKTLASPDYSNVP